MNIKDAELAELRKQFLDYAESVPKLLQEQAEILRQECQARVERIFKELEAHRSLVDYDCLMVMCYWYQELKKQEGIQ